MSQWVKFKFQYLSNCFACTLRTISLVIRCMLFCFSPLHCLLRIEPLQLLSISLFWVVHFASPKVLPIVFNFFSLFLFQLWNVLPWFLCPCVFQSYIFSAGVGFFNVWPIHSHALFFMCTFAGSWLVWSRSCSFVICCGHHKCVLGIYW